MADTDRVWIVDDDPSIRWVLGKALSKAGIAARSFAGGEEALERLVLEKPAVIVTDVRMPGMSGLELLEAIHARIKGVAVIVMTAYSDLDSAVASFQGGAFEYLPKPFDIDDAVALVKRALEQAPAHPAAQPRGEGVPEIVGEAPAMQAVFRAVGRLSASSMNVLICGESGTGKELLAKALHRTSPRADGPFVAINTAAIPADLLESELFGHERGAFTGAQSQRAGRFEQADGGTLFLDEIGDMPFALQTRLLRVLSEGRFFRVGGHREVAVDVRIIAATHQDLDARVAESTFREDLFHRLNVIQITLPPLRERLEDLPGLAARFLGEVAAELGVPAKSLTPEAEAALRRYRWAGNVRELENLCRRLTVMAPGRVVGVQDLPDPGTGVRRGEDGWVEALRSFARERLERGGTDILGALNRDLERCLIEEALRCTAGRKQQAAQRLGLGRNTLTRKLKELGIGNV
jgi:two-component system nitrogen regulation response regulator GlnG